DDVDLVIRGRAVLDLEERAGLGLEREAEGIAVPHRVHVRARARGREHRIVRRHRAVAVHPEDLPIERVGILREPAVPVSPIVAHSLPSGPNRSRHPSWIDAASAPVRMTYPSNAIASFVARYRRIWLRQSEPSMREAHT